MFFEKFVNSKFYNIVDLIIRVIWVNILTLLFSLIGLFFFSFGPAILSGVYVVKLIYQKYDGPIFPLYYKTFKRFYNKATIIFLIYTIFVLVLSFNIVYFLNQMDSAFSWFDFICFMLMIIGFLITVPALFHSLLVFSCYENSRIKDLLVDGYKLSFAFILRGVVFMGLIFGIIYLSLLIPIFSMIIGFFSFLTIIEFVLFRAYNKKNLFDKLVDDKAEELINMAR